MRRMRGRGWMVDLFLWVCPVAGVGIFVGEFLVSGGPQVQPNSRDVHTVVSPLPAWGLLPLAATLLGLTVALLSRRTLGFFAGASFLLLLAVTAAWPRSHWVADAAAFAQLERDVATSYGLGYREWRFDSASGRLSFRSKQLRPPLAGLFFLSPGLNYWSYSPVYGESGANVPLLRRLGFEVAVKPRWYTRRGGITFALALPYWFLCLLATPVPLAWTVRYRRRRRAARRAIAGQCVGCGYDLRATPDPAGARLAVCPECGGRAA